MDKGTQQDKVLELLGDGNWHSTLEIRERLFIMQSATRIWELKNKRNFDIVKEMKPYDPNNPASVKVAWYKLVPKGQIKLFNIAVRNN